MASISAPFGAEQMLQILLSGKEATVVYVSEELHIGFINKAMLNLWNKKDDILNQPLIESAPEFASFIPLLNEVWQSGTTYKAIGTIANINIGGELRARYFDFEYKPILDHKGATYAIINSARDVTDRVEFENLLQQKEKNEQALNEQVSSINEEHIVANEELASLVEKLAATIEQFQTANEELQLSKDDLLEINARYAIALDAGAFASTEVDLVSGTMICNEQFNHIFGLSRGQAFTYPEMFAAMLPAHRERVRGLAIAARDNQSIYEAEYEVMWPDGTVHWLSAHGRARYNKDGVAVKMVGILSEITEIKQDEQRKSDFIGMVSHELKTPLTSLTGYLQLMESRTRKYNDDFLANGLDKAKLQVKKMTTMINGFLNVSRLDAGKIHLNKQAFELDTLVKDTIEDVMFTSNDQRIIFMPSGPVNVFADKDKIGNVITNLLTNALKYAPNDKAIQVYCSLENNNAIFSVKDSGIGIKQEDISKLFDRFYRTDVSTASTVLGFGIGLYLSAEIISGHNGRIWAESKIGKGSTFFFSVPEKV